MRLAVALQRLQSDPNGLAIVDATGDCSWQELFAGVLDAVDLLRGESVEPGGHIALWPANRKEYYQCLLGAIFAGAWITPLNQHLTRSEVRYIIEDSEASRVLVAGRSHESLEGLSCLSLQPLHVVKSAQTVFDELNALLADTPGGVLMYTSGTTGKPKGVRRNTPATVSATLNNWCELGESIGLDGNGPHLVTGPVYHAAPGLYALYDLLNGSPVILMERFDSEQCVALIEQHRVRHTHLVPTLFVRLLRDRALFSRDYDLSSLQLVLHGAAPIAPAVKRAMIDWWGSSLVEYWGGSESGIITRVEARDWLEREGTVGRPLPQYQVSVRDENFNALPPQEIGTLYARRSGVPRPFEYHRDLEKTRSCYVQDWFTLGDMGWLDEAGYAYIADRRNNLIISGGVNVYPAEVEGVLLAHQQVLDVAVVGVDDPEWGKRVHAIVQPAVEEGDWQVLQQQLIDLCGNNLASFKCPRSWEFVRELPRFDSGKLYRSRLEKPAEH